jgi:hypothetical protein
MAILPQTSPAPDPITIFMSQSTSPSNSEPPAATPYPPPPTGPDNAVRNQQPLSSAQMQLLKPLPALFPHPKLRLEVRDLGHPGSSIFLGSIDASSLLSTAVSHVQALLYNAPGDAATHCPPTRSVTLILRPMDGVAYTTGTELDADHKEIHFSLDYVHSARGGRAAAEITGVVVHELVHCYQWNALGSCPSGLVEGVADWVRLSCGLSPPHWKRELDGRWDRGYQHTAYFLQYLEERFGHGTVRRLNEKLRLEKYHEKPFWTELLGRPVSQLWEDYVGHGKMRNGTAISQSSRVATVNEATQTT